MTQTLCSAVATVGIYILFTATVARSRSRQRSRRSWLELKADASAVFKKDGLAITRKWVEEFTTTGRNTHPGASATTPNPDMKTPIVKDVIEQPASANRGWFQRSLRHPVFDADGYPTEETELAIKAWDFPDAPDWIEYIREAWNHHYGRMWEEKGLLKLATGGWSGNEAITHSMRENHVLWGMLWESSHRGGLEVLRIPNPK